MKTSTLISFAALAATASVHAQGPLTPPPGAPAPVMKSLDQVEARTPLVVGQSGVNINANGTITISQMGSYYLIGNLSLTAVGASGIIINTSNVILDLNGFALIHTIGNGGDAVAINAPNVTVRNGTIRGGTTLAGSTFTLAGWDDGIASSTNYPNLVVEGVNVSGVRGHGINLFYEGSRIERCSAHTVGGMGFYGSSISFSTARKTGSFAISASSDPDSGSVSDCFGETVSVSGATGIHAPDGAVSNSRGIAKSGYGINAETATNCYGTSETATGLVATVANNCIGTSTNSIGLSASNATNCVGTSTSGTYGLQAAGTASFCRGTRVSGTALQAAIAIGCTSGGGTISSPQKHLGTP